MSKRKAISKKIRFEIFKRDCFKCQYCGASAPDAILHVDHIDPVANGGDNNPLNLVTSCEGCNQGKGARKLSDNAEVERQRQEMATLGERKSQLEAMLEWRSELARLDEHEIDLIASEIDALIPGRSLNDIGRADLKKYVKKYGASEILESANVAAEQYLSFDEEGYVEEDSTAKFLKMIPRIAWHRANGNVDSELYYIRGILRNRLTYVNERMAIDLMRRAKVARVDMESVKDLAKRVTSWSQFKTPMEDYLRENGDG